MMDPNDPVAIARRLGLPDSLAAFMPRYIKIESGGNPNARTGSYYGLLQMGPDEIRRYGGSGAAQGTQMYADRARWFEKQFGRPPSPTELYLTNQQGEGGVTAHLQNPGAPAWQNMLSTAEGQRKGEAWAKKAIWGNVPDDLKKQFPGGVNSLTSQQFMDIWKNKVERTPIPPRPPGDIPQPGGTTGDVAAATVPGTAYDAQGHLVGTRPSPNYPGRALPASLPVDNAPGSSVTLPQRRPPAAGGVSSPTTPATGTGAMLGDQIIKAMGPRGAGVSSYVDPNTGHQIIGSGGSGEEAMGITRDIGKVAPPPPRSPAPVAPTAPTPTPSTSPPSPVATKSPIDMFNAKPLGEQSPDLVPPRTPGGTPLAPPSAGLLAAESTPAPQKQSTLQGLPLAPYNVPQAPPPQAPPPPPDAVPAYPAPQSVLAQIPQGLSPFGAMPPPSTDMSQLPLWPFATDIASMQPNNWGNDYAFMPY